LVVPLLFCHLDRSLLVGYDCLGSKVVRVWDWILVLRTRGAMLMRRSQVLWVLLLILLLLRLVLFSVLLDGGAEADLSLSQAEVRGMSL
jgi:hypothetical protein